MTVTTDETPEIDWEAELGGAKVEATSGPLTGSRGTTTRSPGRPRGSRSQRKLDALQSRLSTEMFSAGALIGVGLHTTGYYICQESDNFTQAVVQLAAKRPEWITALEHIADVQPGIVIGRTVVGIGASLAVDRGRADPEKSFMKFLGVYAAWQAVNNPQNGGVDVNGYQPPPAGAFVPVGTNGAG